MSSKENKINIPKLCTDYNQSVLLSDYLSERTADMSWKSIYDENHMMSDFKMDLVPASLNRYKHKPAWSLPALCSLLRDNGFVTTLCADGSVICRKLGEEFVYRNEKSVPAEYIDSVFEMVLKLLKKGLITT